MEAGTTWYLNGEDSLDLTFEKDIKANGVTEHQDYRGMGSMSFALYLKRTSTLPPATLAQSAAQLPARRPPGLAGPHDQRGGRGY